MVLYAERSVPIGNKDVLSWIFDKCDYDPDKPIYIDASDESNSISWRQARMIVRKLAAGFRAAGLKKGDCVCLHAFNHIMYPMLFLGIIAAGGIFTGANPSYTQFELEHHLKTARVGFVIGEPEMLSTLRAAAKACGIPENRIWCFNVYGQALPQGATAWTELMSKGEADWPCFDDEQTATATTAARLFSSGTTGLPKAVPLSHRNFVAQHTLVHELVQKDYPVSRVLALPMFHAAAVPVAHTTALKAGQLSIIMRRFELESFLALHEKHQVTEMAAVPPIVIAIIMSPVTKKYSLRSIRTATCGAAPLGLGEQRKLHALFGKGSSFCQLWGMTETSCVASMFHYPESDDTGSVGYLLPTVDAKIIDDDGNDITRDDTRGELCVRGPSIIRSYFENPEANASSFDADNFFKTGDIVYRDSKSKKWYIVDRKKELIKVRGFQVAPPEIEGVLLSHPHIIDVAVIGVQKQGDGANEHPRAYVVRRPGPEGEALEESTIRAYCGQRLARYKDLTGGVVFMEAIPKNASGKILKRVLRDMAKAELEKAKL